MTSSLGVQLTPGQRCLLDLLQRKLLNTIQSYARLSLERQKAQQTDEIDNELRRLKEKIRRISARQKRFTLEIINGNGNNTIPKESFFEALGLVTKEALSKLSSKTNERRRRTTANPRFSHEAIQAKRALEPLQRRLEPRVRDNKRDPSGARKPQRHQQSNNSIDSANNNNSNATNNNNNRNAGGTVNNGSSNNRSTNNNQQAAMNNGAARSSSRVASNRNNRNLMIHNERQELLVRFNQLQRQINTKVSQIKDKQESNKKLEKQNELIRLRGLDIISAINFINPELTRTTIEGGNRASGEQTDNPSSQNDQSLQPTEPLDIWIDMKCDESLDGLD